MSPTPAHDPTAPTRHDAACPLPAAARGRPLLAVAGLATLTAGIAMAQLPVPLGLAWQPLDERLAVLGTRPTAAVIAFAFIALGGSILAALGARRLPVLQLPDRLPPPVLTPRGLGVALMAGAAVSLALLCVLAGRGGAVAWYPLLLPLGPALATAGLWFCDDSPATRATTARVRRTDVAAMAALVVVVLAASSYRIQNWYFSFIGDEGAFFVGARDLIHGRTVDLLDLSYVYAKHPLADSLYQSLFLSAFGENVVAWRMAEIAVAAAAAALTYLVIVRLASCESSSDAVQLRLTALVGGLVVGCSTYTMAFTHIGYNNLHTMVPPLVIMLWLADTALPPRAPRLFGLGCLLGLCAYTFLATTAIWPVVVVFLAMGALRGNLSGTLGAAVVVVAGFLFMVLPLLCADPSSLIANLEASQALGIGRERSWVLGFVGSLGAFWHNSRWFSHHMAGSLLGPVAGAFTATGIAAAALVQRRSRGDRFLLLWFVLGTLAVAVSHSFAFPTVTRLLFVLPSAALMAARGATVTAEVLQVRLGVSRRTISALLAAAAAAMVAADLYQLHVVVPRRLPSHHHTATVRALQEHPSAPVLDVGYTVDGNREVMLSYYPELAKRHRFVTEHELAATRDALDPSTVLLVYYSAPLAARVESIVGPGWSRRCASVYEGRCQVWMLEPAERD